MDGLDDRIRGDGVFGVIVYLEKQAEFLIMKKKSFRTDIVMIDGILGMVRQTFEITKKFPIETFIHRF
jgi:hypothetical protein